MPPTSRIPPQLAPFVRLPRDPSLLLLTSTLGASANWLIARFIGETLAADDAAEGPKNVLLVSWMRDLDFWRAEVRRGAGVDLGMAAKKGRFAYVDGLGSLFLEDGEGGSGKSVGNTGAGVGAGRPQPQQQTGVLPARGPQTILPARGGPLPLRQQPQAQPQAQTQTSAIPLRPAQPQQSQSQSHTLTTPTLAHLQATIETALSTLTPTNKTLLILDTPDLLLASSPTLTPSSLTSLFLTLHANPLTPHLLLHLQADHALLASPDASLSSPPQPLQIAHHNLLVQTAHMAAKVLGTRVLDTGIARDVSGVLRCTVNPVGAGAVGFDRGGVVGGDVEEGFEEGGREVLYKVGADGGVRVFERGAG